MEVKHSPVLVNCDRCGTPYTETRAVFDAVEDFGNEHLCPTCAAWASAALDEPVLTLHRPAEDEYERDLEQEEEILGEWEDWSRPHASSIQSI